MVYKTSRILLLDQRSWHKPRNWNTQLLHQRNHCNHHKIQLWGSSFHVPHWWAARVFIEGKLFDILCWGVKKTLFLDTRPKQTTIFVQLRSTPTYIGWWSTRWKMGHSIQHRWGWVLYLLLFPMWVSFFCFAEQSQGGSIFTIINSEGLGQSKGMLQLVSYPDDWEGLYTVIRNFLVKRFLISTLPLAPHCCQRLRRACKNRQHQPAHTFLRPWVSAVLPRRSASPPNQLYGKLHRFTGGTRIPSGLLQLRWRRRGMGIWDLLFAAGRG